MERVNVTSSQIKSIGYDPNTKILEVEFNSNSSIYQYHPVTEEAHGELMNAESKGKHFHAHFRNNDLLTVTRVN